MRLMFSRSILRRSMRTLRVRQISSAMFVGVTEPNSAPVGPAFISNRRTVSRSVFAIASACSAVEASCRARCASRLRSSATRASVASSASLPRLLLEGDVVVAGLREVGRLGGRTGGDELVASAALGRVAAGSEELDALGDDLHRLALRPVLGVPLAPVQPAVDADGAALA